MKTVELAPGVRSSVIGIGTASMMGAEGRERSLRALSLAFDLGVTHFDTAPSYGYGESEKLLGEFLQGRREGAVIATKFGIEVAPAAMVLRPLKSSVRAALRLLRRRKTGGTSQTGAPQGSVKAPAISRNLHRHVVPSGPRLITSVETSLRRLGTDYLDLLLLHEPPAAVDRPEEFYAAVDGLKRAGKIRAFGLASMASALPTHTRDAAHFDVLQFDCPADPVAYASLKSTRGRSANVIFSLFRSRPSNAPTDVLRQTLQDFPSSVILCTMFSESHIRANCEAGASPPE